MSNSRKFRRNYPGFALFLILGALTFSGCATSQTRSIDALADDSSGSPAGVRPELKPGPNTSRSGSLRPDAVQPGYLWEISSLADKGINGKFRVDFDGKLRLAYGIVIDSDGLNDTQMKDKIVESFRPFLKSTGEIHVALVQKKLWIDVRGLVSKPDDFSSTPPQVSTKFSRKRAALFRSRRLNTFKSSKRAAQWRSAFRITTTPGTPT